MTVERDKGSFRDPAGAVFIQDGEVFRSVTRSYAEHYDSLISSGLYADLTRRGWLIDHSEVENVADSTAYRILKPRRIPYVSYPYEWCFSQLREAALLTLDIARRSLDFGLLLKDASAYNVQFIGTRPVFIDTLSFARYEEGRPWVAYRQFCQHFLGPLALIGYRDLRLRHLLLHYIDGIPLDLTAGLLPLKARVRYGLAAHIGLHARSQKRHGGAGQNVRALRIPALSKARLIALLESLRSTVEGLPGPSKATEWSDYYDATNYSAEAIREKERLVVAMVDELFAPDAIVHDLGANTGRFSRLIAASGRYVVAHDIDELAVEKCFNESRLGPDDGVLPLTLDLTNPAPALGWAHQERLSAVARMRGGSVVALALIHHLAISNNVPLSALAEFFATLAQSLVIEFVPREDSQVQLLLSTREDIFPGYSRDGFESEFSRHFQMAAKADVPGSLRTLYAFRRRG